MIKKKELMEFLRSHFRLKWDGIHGAPHWARVLHNGLMLAEKEGARSDVVTLFAFLHDHERIHDDHDTEHGPAASRNALRLRGTYFEIDDEGFALLCQAMDGHSNGMTEANITVQCCWDADRLDLGRVGIIPHPKYLCTQTAKDPEVIRVAYDRSIQG